MNSRKDPIAIVGMGCVFPNAFNVEHYWQTLLEGKTSFMPVPKELWENSLFYSPDRREPDRYYDDVVSYPFGFKLPIDKFKCSPDILKNLCREEQYFITALNECFLDIRSQVQRTKLFVGHTSLADAINKWHLSQEIGRDFRSVLSDEKVLHRVQEVLDKGLLDHKDLAPEKVLTHERTSFLAGQILGGRVDLDLIDAACASSLFTLDLGIMELLKGTSDMVICGGMSYSAPFGKVLFCRLGGSSRSGVYPFQARADGTVFGDGSGFVALKKLSTALKDGDQIHALIPEIGTASDGKGKSIYAPSTSGQILAMDRAYKNSGISPASVQFIEAHGTGTAAGDATEFKSLQNFFEKNSVQKTSVGLGSVKALFGHLGWVAGTAALIKMVLCLKNKTIVAQPNFDSLNPALDLKNSALWIPQKNSPWPSDGREPRRAGINGFGFGGTNAHVILQEYIPASGNLSEISNKTSSECTAVSGADDFVIVGAGSYFPNLPNWQALCEKIENGENIEPSFHGGFKPNNIKFRVIDRSAAVIDPSQFLVLESGIQALAAVGDKWKELKAETGVFLSQASALGNQIAVTKRIYARFVKTALDADLELKQLSDIESATQKWVDATLETNPPPNEDSNPGIMPNVTAGRLCNYLDLQGPNFSINSGGQSLIRTFEIALSHLLFNKCEVALVGACHIAKFESYRDLWQRMAMTGPLDEGAVVFAVMKKEVAQRRGIKAWANISLLRVEDNRKPTPLVSPVLFSAPETGIMLKLLSKALKGEATRPLVTSESAQTQWQITVSPAAVVEESVPEFSLCGEVKFADAGQTEFHRTLTEESDAYLKHHLVKEKPTLPGTFMIETAAQAAKKLFPERVIHRISEIRFLKFIRPPIELRTRVTRHHDGDGREYLKITLLSDLISKKGQILQKDNLHFSCEVHWRDVQDTKPVPGPCKAEMSSLTSVVDSYHEIGAEVYSDGPFRTISSPQRNRDFGSAQYIPVEHKISSQFKNFVLCPFLLDGALRLSALSETDIEGRGRKVPLGIKTILFGKEINEHRLQELAAPVEIVFERATGKIWGLHNSKVLFFVEGMHGKDMGDSIPLAAPKKGLISVPLLAQDQPTIRRYMAVPERLENLESALVSMAKDSPWNQFSLGTIVSHKKMFGDPEQAGVWSLDAEAKMDSTWPQAIGEANPFLFLDLKHFPTPDGDGKMYSQTLDRIGSFFLGLAQYAQAHSECQILIHLAHARNEKKVWNPWVGFFRGFVRSLICEAPGNNIKLIMSDQSHDQMISHLLVEAKHVPHSMKEKIIYYSGGQRHSYTLVEKMPVPLGPPREISDESVFLITGGGRGIGGFIADFLVRRHKGIKLALIGSAPRDRFRDLVRDLESQYGEFNDKNFYLYFKKKEGSSFTIANAKSILAKINSERDLNRNLNALREAGVEFEYYACDVRDADQVQQTVNQIYEKFKTIDVVVHSAGIYLGRRLSDKTAAEFNFVVDVKLKGFANLLNAMDVKKINTWINFGSYVGYFGNDGQLDYCSGNEGLSTMSNYYNSLYPQTKFVTISWPCWDEVGMFAQGGMGLIVSRGLLGLKPVNGVGLFLYEAIQAAKGESEVVYCPDSDKEFYTNRKKSA